MNDHNECPTCTQDWVENTDYECGCCGRPASEHIRVTSLCRILRETQQRENALIVERDALQEQLDAAIMLGKMQERRHERELEQVREQYRLSSVCRELKAENERLKRIAMWPHDADPFASPDHDNDSRNYP